MRTTLHPIDSSKLKSLINEHGGIQEVAYHTKVTGSCIYETIRRGTASKPLIEKLNFIGIRFEDYKPEEPKPEPKPEEPVKETVFTNRSEQCLITLVNMVGEMRNNMIVLNEKLDKLIELWGEA